MARHAMLTRMECARLVACTLVFSASTLAGFVSLGRVDGGVAIVWALAMGLAQSIVASIYVPRWIAPPASIAGFLAIGALAAAGAALPPETPLEAGFTVLMYGAIGLALPAVIAGLIVVLIRRPPTRDGDEPPLPRQNAAPSARQWRLSKLSATLFIGGVGGGFCAGTAVTLAPLGGIAVITSFAATCALGAALAHIRGHWANHMLGSLAAGFAFAGVMGGILGSHAPGWTLTVLQSWLPCFAPGYALVVFLAALSATRLALFNAEARVRERCCRNCGYDLRGSRELRCPECGESAAALNAKHEERSPRRDAKNAE